MSDADHEELLDALRASSAMIVLSGYPNSLYDNALSNWRRVTIDTHADGARPRTEALWLNAQACAALDAMHMPLFGTEPTRPASAPAVEDK